MLKRLLILSGVILTATLIASTSFATGFRLPEQSNSAMGMASAFVGQADDASAVWYNPAGMTQLQGTQVMGGVIAIFPAISHEGEYSERKIHLPIHFYATHKLGDQMAFGVGINNPFGLETDWDPQNSSTRYVATFSKVVTTEVNPNVAYKINDNLSVAAGVAFVHLRATLEKKLDFSALGLGDRNFRLSGDGDGWGANAAVHYKATQNLNLGLSYRSRVKIDVDGTAEAFVPAPSPINPGSNPAKTQITLPDLIQFGASFKATDKLTLNADIDYTLWSTYDRVVVTSDTILGLTTLAGSPTDTQTDEKDWKDVWCLRLGGQYKLSDQWKVKAGYLYDKNPVKEKLFETRVPDSDRQGISLGAGFTSGPLTVDAAYLYLRFNDRTINNSTADDTTPNPTALNGNYKSQAHLWGVTLGYKF